MTRRLFALTLAAVTVIALPACSKKDKKESASTTTVAPSIAPLTGLPDPTGGSRSRAALTVKVGNNPDGRPQSGLDSADIVFEEIAEGGITRFAAVFNSTVPDQVGPVRSVRGMDPDVVRPLFGIFAYSGGTSGNVEAIQSVEGLLTVDETDAGNAMTRSDDRSSPDNLYVVSEAMFGRGGAPKPPVPFFSYLADKEEFVGERITSFTVGFAGEYAPTYTWDEADGTWKRSYGGDPFVSSDGVQIAPENVVVQFIEYPDFSEGITVGEGDAWVFSDGQLIRGRWSRPDAARAPTFSDLSGSPIKLTPGQSWVELLTNGADVTLVTPPPTTTTSNARG